MNGHVGHADDVESPGNNAVMNPEWAGGQLKSASRDAEGYIDVIHHSEYYYNKCCFQIGIMPL